MSLWKPLVGALSLLLAAGCVGRKAFLDLPAEQRQHVRLIPAAKPPEVRFASNAASSAREFGLVGLMIAESIENSGHAFGAAQAIIGTCEAELIRAAISKRLQAVVGQVESPHPEAAPLELKVHAVGLREPERNRFAPFAEVSVRLETRDRQAAWRVRVQSTHVHSRPLEDYRRQPELYRQEFLAVAEDIAHQLVDGPIRPINAY